MKTKDNVIMMHRTANTPQRTIVAVVVPLVILAVSYGVIDFLANEMFSGYTRRSSPIGDFDKTWLMWAVVLFIVGVFEYNWFKTPISKKDADQ